MADGDSKNDSGADEGELPDFIDTGDDESDAKEAVKASKAADVVVPEPESESLAASGDDAVPAPKESVDEAPAPAPVLRHATAHSDPNAHDPSIRVKPHSEGLFDTDPREPEPELLAEVEEAMARRRRSTIAIGVIVGTVLVVAIGAFYLFGQEERRGEIQAFFAGSIVEHKTAEVNKLKEKWSDEDRRSRNRYGDVTLTYFPADAHVKVFQTKFEQDGASWLKNEATRKKVEEIELPNESANLKPGQTIERLPVVNLPIFEATKGEDGSVSVVNTYEYRVEFVREGYHSQTKTWREDDWQRVGPGNEVVEWPGLDLVPKPETLKANFSKAMRELFCLMQKKEIKTLQEVSADENFQMILLRTGFKTKEDFQIANDALTAGEFAEWWKTEQAEIAKAPCEDAPAPKP